MLWIKGAAGDEVEAQYIFNSGLDDKIKMECRIVLMDMGYTVDERESMRSDLAWVRGWRERSQKIADIVWKVVITSIAGAMLTVIGMGAKEYFK